ncbi:Sec-independent protein translocase protein TatA [Muribaculaceae bacterium]|nr:Sec-independent protein translocase protein TatA [Muribaculaceae bacterium]
MLLLFGGKKIPELMHGIGKGVAGFRKGIKEIENEIKTTPAPDSEKDNNA